MFCIFTIGLAQFNGLGSNGWVDDKNVLGSEKVTTQLNEMPSDPILGE